jgi:hypothetical protein
MVECVQHAHRDAILYIGASWSFDTGRRHRRAVSAGQAVGGRRWCAIYNAFP